MDVSWDAGVHENSGNPLFCSQLLRKLAAKEASRSSCQSKERYTSEDSGAV